MDMGSRLFGDRGWVQLAAVFRRTFAKAHPQQTGTFLQAHCGQRHGAFVAGCDGYMRERRIGELLSHFIQFC